VTFKAELRLKGAVSFFLSFAIAYSAMRWLFDFTGDIPFLVAMLWAQISEALTAIYVIGEKLGEK
jgi:hypothetical protein